MVLGYSGYYILGHYLNKTKLRKKTQIIIYILGFFGFGLTIILTFAASHNENRLVENYFDYLTLNVLFSAAAVFMWFKTRKYNSRKLNALMAKLSKYSFGAYVIHMFILNTLKRNQFSDLFSNPILRIYCTGITVYLIATGISAILNHIPGINKYVV